MIQNYYCKEKIDADQSLGLTREVIFAWWEVNLKWLL